MPVLLMAIDQGNFADVKCPCGGAILGGQRMNDYIG